MCRECAPLRRTVDGVVAPVTASVEFQLLDIPGVGLLTVVTAVASRIARIRRILDTKESCVGVHFSAVGVPFEDPDILPGGGLIVEWVCPSHLLVLVQ